MTVLARRNRRALLLLIYDSAGPRRKVPPTGTRADLHDISL